MCNNRRAAEGAHSEERQMHPPSTTTPLKIPGTDSRHYFFSYLLEDQYQDYE